MIRHALLIGLALATVGCGRAKPVEVKAAADPKPFTLACTGQITDEIDVARGTLRFSLTIDAANSEALLTGIGSDRTELLPAAMQNRDGDIVKIVVNDREIAADLNSATRRDSGNRVAIDRRTGKFTGPSSNGSCAKTALVALPGQKF